MRIAVYHNLPSGGAKRALCEMVRRLAGRHELDVYTLSCSEHEFADLRPFVRRHSVSPFSPLRLLRRPLGRLNQLIYLADLYRLDRLDRSLAANIDRGRYDLVFVHHCRYRQSPALLRFLRTPAVYYCQEPPRWIYDPPIARPYLTPPDRRSWHMRLDPLPWLYRRTFRRHDRRNTLSSGTVLVNSNHSQEHVWRLYGKRPVVCYLGVDTEAFRPMPVPREPIVLSVGALSAIKGHDLLVEGLARVSVQPRPALVIVSNHEDPSEKAYLEHLARQHGVSLGTRVGVGDDELARWYCRSRLVGVTPVLEPLGLVPLESMACETPVVGVREGGVRETVVDGVTGWLVDRDPGAVAKAVDDLLLHPDRAAEFGREGRGWVQERWTWDRSVTRIEAALGAATGAAL